MSKAVAIVSTSFGFGPVSKANYIAQEIRELELGYEISFLGSGIALDYMSINSAVDKIVDINVDEDIEETILLLRGYDYIFNVMNMAVLKDWKRGYPKMSMVDSLSWMWDETPNGIEKLDFYFIQDFLIDNKKLDKYSLQKEVTLISPITSKKEVVAKTKNQLLVNFSGAVNPFGGEDYYLDFIDTHCKILEKNLLGKFDEILITTNEKFCSLFRKKYRQLNFSFFKHEEFLSEMISSRFVLTTPGITTTLECIHNQLEFGFLLPQNYSQALMQQMYFERIGFKRSQPLSLFSSGQRIEEDMDELDGVNLVKNVVTKILRSNSLEIEKMLTNIIEKKEQSLNDILNINFNISGQQEIVQRALL